MKLESIRNTYPSLTINTSDMYKDANYWIKQCLDKDLEIKRLKESNKELEEALVIVKKRLVDSVFENARISTLIEKSKP